MFRPELISFIVLLERSPDAVPPPPDVRSGWKKYSDMLKGLVMQNHERFPGVYEVDEVNNLIRLSAEGAILRKWMYYVPKP